MNTRTCMKSKWDVIGKTTLYVHKLTGDTKMGIEWRMENPGIEIENLTPFVSENPFLIKPSQLGTISDKNLDEITKEKVTKEREGLLKELMSDPPLSENMTRLVTDRIIEINRILRN